jgi:hypothetical protein
MGIVIAIVNNKGGVGKTMAACYLAHILGIGDNHYATLFSQKILAMATYEVVGTGFGTPSFRDSMRWKPYWCGSATRSSEADNLALQTIHGFRFDISFGKVALILGVAGIEELGGRFFVLGLGYEFLPFQLTSPGPDSPAQLAELRAWIRLRGSCCRRAATAAQGEDKGGWDKKPVPGHDVSLLHLSSYRKFFGSANVHHGMWGGYVKSMEQDLRVILCCSLKLTPE